MGSPKDLGMGGTGGKGFFDQAIGYFVDGEVTDGGFAVGGSPGTDSDGERIGEIEKAFWGIEGEVGVTEEGLRGGEVERGSH